jgi:hypothetical protein
MSASILWQPVSTNWHVAGGGSSVVEVLREAFHGENEFSMTAADSSLLHGMYLATRDECYRKLKEAIEDNGPIVVRVQY